MTNLYYNFTDPVSPGAIVDALKYNQEMEKITEAFDNFPPAIEFTSGALNYGAQPPGQPVNTYNIQVTAIPFGAAYQLGNNVAFKIATANTGPSLLSVSGNDFRAVVMGTAGALVSGDFRLGGIYTAVWDGSLWRTLEMSTRFLGIAEVQNTAAQDSAAAASTSATNATNSASAASTSASAAAGSASASSASASAAAGSSSAAQASAANTGDSEAAASTSATNAASSASFALSNRSIAQVQADGVANSAAAAANSATAAANSATAAANSATAAADSDDEAQDIISDPGFNDRVVAAILAVDLVVNSVEFFAANIDPNTMYAGSTWVRLPENCTIRMADAAGINVFQTAGTDTTTVTTAGMPQHSHSVTPGSTSSTTLVATLVPTVVTGETLTSSFTRNFELVTVTATSDSQAAGTATASTDPGHVHKIDSTVGTGGSGTPSKIVGSAFTPPAGTVTGTPMSTEPGHTHPVNRDHTHQLPAGSYNHTHTIDVGPHSHEIIRDTTHNHFVTPGPHTHSATLTVDPQGSGSAFSVINSNLKLVAWYRTA